MKIASIATIKSTYPTRCCGCGKFGRFLCAGCKELQDAVRERVEKLWSTVENRGI